jgi:glycosyltransferase involved in cell wall biosynthesis
MDRKISLAIPHYNNSSFLLDALMPSLLDDRITEIIICDDDSSDIVEVERIIHSLNISKIKLYKNKANIGCYHNKLNAISKCSNQWAILLDSDNVISKEFIDKLYEVPEWYITTIYAPSYAYTFPQGPSELLNYTAYGNTFITPEIYINNVLTNTNFMCLINNCNYFLPVQEYINCMNSFSYNRWDIDSQDSAVLFTDWLYKNNTVFIVKDLIYKHRLHSNSNYMKNHTRCNENEIRKYLINKLQTK